jgi:hypothetical protein
VIVVTITDWSNPISKFSLAAGLFLVRVIQLEVVSLLSKSQGVVSLPLTATSLSAQALALSCQAQEI